MHKARATLLREIGPADLSATHACRLFGKVVRVTHSANGFVAGTARVGQANVVFDGYSFQQAGRGFQVGPFFMRAYSAETGDTLRKHACAVGGRTTGTMIYGTVIKPEKGPLRFVDAVVADELHFFWSTLQFGRLFVHKNRDRYYLAGGAGCGDLYAAACILVGDMHTLVYACMPPPRRPLGSADLRLSMGAVAFVILLSLACRSSEPFRLFEQVLHAHEGKVDPAVFDCLYLPAPTTSAVTSAPTTSAVTSAPNQAAVSAPNDTLYEPALCAHGDRDLFRTCGAGEGVAAAAGDMAPSSGRQRITAGCIRYAIAARVAAAKAHVVALSGIDGDESEESCGLLSEEEDMDALAEGIDSGFM